MTETYLGPMALGEALTAAEMARGVCAAVSVPHGDYVAIGIKDHGRLRVRVRKVMRLSGRLGSVTGTGEWLNPDALPPNVQWRPL